ncbi:MAG TPA: helix-turn-helix domain-containing protein, partial [Bacteroidota bacterium]|nr:helix-turn-helix domain-containing protein [Bacteroidota bacterium]
MTLASFGEELRKLRQERRVSLMDISSSTRINMKFLEAIEAGRFGILPQTYIRAFLREYAESVGAAVDEVLRKYDEASHRVSNPGSSGTSSRTSQEFSTRSDKIPPPSLSSFLRKNTVFAVVALAAVGLTLYLMSTGSNLGVSQKPVEVSFDNVVKETEAAAIKNTASTPSVPTLNPPQDSLRLEMATKDSVWMSILIDGKRTEEYLFAPNRRKSWVAKERFSITMGNAGGATFILNGKQLGAL